MRKKRLFSFLSVFISFLMLLSLINIPVIKAEAKGETEEEVNLDYESQDSEISPSFSTNGHTQAEAVSWIKARHAEGWAQNYDGVAGPQCVDLIKYYTAWLGVNLGTGHAYAYASKALPSGWTYQSTPQPGDIAVWTAYKGIAYEYGHVALVESVGNGTFTQYGVNGANGRGSSSTLPNSNASTFIHPDFPSPKPIGHEMTSGYDRVLPDGDYVISCAGSTDKARFYYMDIPGGEVPAASGTNVSLYISTNSPPELGPHDIWTINYSDGFYTIKQKDTNMSLDVKGGSKEAGANVQVFESNDGSNQKWAISKNGRNGYRIQTKCSGFSVDVAGAAMQSGTNIQIWENNDLDAQSWLFIPYKPAQPLENGKYTFVSAIDGKHALGVNKNSLNSNVTATELTDNLTDTYNTFEITKLDNGYYSIINTATGRALELTNGYSNLAEPVCLFGNNGSITQQWEIRKTDSGYALIVRCSGMAAGVAGGAAANGAIITQNYYTGDIYQKWNIVTPESLTLVQCKAIHYKEKLDGTYVKAAEVTYQKTPGTKIRPGTKTYTGFITPERKKVTVKADGSTVVKYYYKRNSYQLKWNLSGGTASGSYTKGSVKYGTKIKAPVPTRDGYEFTGWDKTVAKTMPAKDVTYKAKWRKLTQEEQVRAFVERFYVIILDRPAEPQGLNYWTDNLLEGKKKGSDVAAGFINSVEFQGKKISNEVYLKKLYSAFFNREPDKAGYDYWMKELKSGKSRDYVLRGFINSVEFDNLCKKYGIKTGSY